MRYLAWALVLVICGCDMTCTKSNGCHRIVVPGSYVRPTSVPELDQWFRSISPGTTQRIQLSFGSGRQQMWPGMMRVTKGYIVIRGSCGYFKLMEGGRAEIHRDAAELVVVRMKAGVSDIQLVAPGSMAMNGNITFIDSNNTVPDGLRVLPLCIAQNGEIGRAHV